MKKLIVANWKMNPATKREAKRIFELIKKGTAKIKNVDTIICPPFVYFSVFEGLPLGGQNIFYKQEGAFTGEISASMLKDMKVEYVIVGHSERRKYFAETNEIINKKLKLALKEGLHPIFCLGEKEDEDKILILEKQITEGLKGISRQNIRDTVIAYEPVWAIGTGRNCPALDAVSSILFIRKTVAKLYNRGIADNIKILYGGSVSADNAIQYLKEPEINGLLVGGVSLNAENFIKIVRSCG